MTTNEMAQILNILQEFYNSPTITDNTIMAWLKLFEEYSYAETEIAVKLMGKEREYTSFPTPANLIKYIELLNNDNNESDLWNIAHRAIGKSSTYTKETFNELPYQVQAFFGNVTALREYGRKDKGK